MVKISARTGFTLLSIHGGSKNYAIMARLACNLELSNTNLKFYEYRLIRAFASLSVVDSSVGQFERSSVRARGSLSVGRFERAN